MSTRIIENGKVLKSSSNQTVKTKILKVLQPQSRVDLDVRRLPNFNLLGRGSMEWFSNSSIIMFNKGEVHRGESPN